MFVFRLRNYQTRGFVLNLTDHGLRCCKQESDYAFIYQKHSVPKPALLLKTFTGASNFF